MLDALWLRRVGGLSLGELHARQGRSRRALASATGSPRAITAAIRCLSDASGALSKGPQGPSDFRLDRPDDVQTCGLLTMRLTAGATP